MQSPRCNSTGLPPGDAPRLRVENIHRRIALATAEKKRKGLSDTSVFDFNEEEEATERLSQRYLLIGQHRKLRRVEKEDFLQSFGTVINSRPADAAVAAACQTIFEQDQNCRDDYELESLDEDSPEAVCTGPYSKEDDAFHFSSRSLSASSSDSDEDGYLIPSTHSTYSPEFKVTENIGAGVRLFPEFVQYGNLCYEDAQITFSSDCVMLEYSNTLGNEVVLCWELHEVLHIHSQWSEPASAAHIDIHVKADAGCGVEKDDILKLMFPVHDKHWLESEQKIISLAKRYKEIWNILSDSCSGELSNDTENRCSNVICSRDYFIKTYERFVDVIYPKGDPDAVCISSRDIELLQPDTFINDTIVDFYIKYLKNKLKADVELKFHFFNSFFFRKFADLDKVSGISLDCQAAFRRVCKWTRKVNIFEKDYIFIPVNFSLHWSLIVICHPGEIAETNVNERMETQKVPCILHMDSLKGSHTQLSHLVRSYLLEEWRERHPEYVEDFSAKFFDLRFVPLEVPQQENMFDCGLFLLHYVELFLEEVPINFSPFMITNLSSFLTYDWFEPAEASRKRSLIQKLIYNLGSEPSEIVAPSSFSSEICSTNEELLMEFHCGPCGESNMPFCNSSPLITAGANELQLVDASFPSIPERAKELDMDFNFPMMGVNPSPIPDCQELLLANDSPLETSERQETLNKENAGVNRDSKCQGDSPIDVGSTASQSQAGSCSPKHLQIIQQHLGFEQGMAIDGDPSPTALYSSAPKKDNEMTNHDHASGSPITISDKNTDGHTVYKPDINGSL